MWITLLVILAVFSYMDIREKKLPVRVLAVGILLSAVAGVYQGKLTAAAQNIWQEGQVTVGGRSVWWDCLITLVAGMLPGILMTLLAFVLKGKLGYGDGVVLSIIGNLVGLQKCLSILLLALLLSFGYSCLLLAVFRKNRNDCFPFIPFYLCSTVIVRLFAIGQ